MPQQQRKYIELDLKIGSTFWCINIKHQVFGQTGDVYSVDITDNSGIGIGTTVIWFSVGRCCENRLVPFNGRGINDVSCRSLYS